MIGTMAFPLSTPVFGDTFKVLDTVFNDTSQVVAEIKKRSLLNFQHYLVTRKLASANQCLRSALDSLHTPEAIHTLALANGTQMLDLAARMEHVHTKVEETLGLIRSIRLGFWERIYKPHIANMQRGNQELLAHIAAFKDSETGLILLTKRDQEAFLTLLENPPEPNEALRSAFNR